MLRLEVLLVCERLGGVGHRGLEVLARQLRIRLEQIGFARTLAQLPQNELQ
jgi:hypothetical protein